MTVQTAAPGTVNVAELLFPATVTVTCAEPASTPDGTAKTIALLLHCNTGTADPLKRTELLFSWVIPKLLPMSVTIVPGNPEEGDRLVICRGASAGLITMLSDALTLF